jgi:hypothetical protein
MSGGRNWKIDNHPIDEHEFSLDDKDDRLADVKVDIQRRTNV